MQFMKRWLSGILGIVLLLGLLPGRALAAGETANWATEAVTTLNEIYSSNLGVSSSLDPMLKSQAATVFTNMGNSEVAATLTGDGKLTREEACNALVKAFTISTGEKTAIQYLYEENIINGKSSDELDVTGDVSFAEFAVLTYRVLNAVGGGMGSGTALKPGTEEYFAWMYLAVRACVPVASGQLNTPINDVWLRLNNNTVTDSTEDEKNAASEGEKNQFVSGEQIWTSWKNKLELNENSDIPLYNDIAEQTLLQAAKTMVDSIGAASIFSDVQPNDWYYDGVMFFADRDIVIGYGNGDFGYNDLTPRYQLVTLLYRIAGMPDVDNIPESNDWAIKQKTWAVQNGYMTPPADEAEVNNWWNGNATREETVVAILKFIADYSSTTAYTDINFEKPTNENTNIAILSRFSDQGDIKNDDSKPYLAYAVSTGMISGTSASTLAPGSEVSRAQMCVLLYRTLIGLDTSKMHDYEQNVQNVLPSSAATDSGEGVNSTEGEGE